MKKIIDGIIVVEGITDEAYLTSFLDVEIIKTNGYQIPKKDVQYLEKYAQNTNILILVDSDEAGNTIRKKLNNLLPTAINLEVDISKCNKRGKHGIAECDKEEILKVLKPYVVEKKLETGNVTVHDLLMLGLTGPNSKTNKEKIINELSLGVCNTKTFIKRLNYRNVGTNILKGILDGNK